MYGTYKKFVATPLCSEGEKKYEYKGCWGELGYPNPAPPNERALPNILAIRGASVKSIDECYGLAAANGYKNFGLQYYGECWAGNNDDWNRYGGLPEAKCGELGTGVSNKVHTIIPSKAPLNVKNVYGNNGSVSCERYCNGNGGGPWNGELPRDWNGARCIGTPQAPDVGCNSTYGSGIVCTCERTGKGWR
jgi:hypothetical protein